MQRRRKLEKALKKALRKFQFLLEAHSHTPEQELCYPKFETWYNQTIVDVYSSTIPDTVTYLCKTLDLECPKVEEAPLKLQTPTQSKKRQLA